MSPVEHNKFSPSGPFLSNTTVVRRSSSAEHHRPQLCAPNVIFCFQNAMQGVPRYTSDGEVRMGPNFYTQNKSPIELTLDAQKNPFYLQEKSLGL